MVISILANGDIKNIIPENIYQGSNKANTIYVVAPFASNIQALISFEVATTGQIIPAILMDSPTSISNELNMWKVNVSQALTQYYGEVKYQIKFLNAEDVVVATARGKFRVQEGVDFDLPESPDEATYTLILEKLSQIEAHYLNGWVEARALKIYNSDFNYSLNTFVLGEQNGMFNMYKSLVENNKGNDLTDAESWQLVQFGVDIQEIVKQVKDYTDEKVAEAIENIENGTTIADKADKDSEGNIITAHYATQEQWVENMEAIEGNAEKIETNTNSISQILDGTKTVNKALKDGSNNIISTTYFNKENIVSGWSNDLSNEKVPSEKLVFDTITNLKSEKAKDIEFQTYQQFILWLQEGYTRDDGFTKDDLRIGTGVLIIETGIPDYWCSSLAKPITINNFTPFEASIDLNNFLAKNNTIEYTPTSDYHPATKKYVDAVASGASGSTDIFFVSYNGKSYYTSISQLIINSQEQPTLSGFTFTREPKVDDLIDIPTVEWYTNTPSPDTTKLYMCRYKVLQIRNGVMLMVLINNPVPMLWDKSIDTTINSNATDKKVPSTKAVYDLVAPIEQAVENETEAVQNIIKGQYLSEGYNVGLHKTESGVTITASSDMIVIDQPITATQGQFDAEDVALLQANMDAYIVFAGEAYYLNGKEHNSGYLTYTNVEYESGETKIKTITITLSTLGWVLTENVVASKDYVDEKIGDIDTLLIDINSGSGV